MTKTFRCEGEPWCGIGVGSDGPVSVAGVMSTMMSTKELEALSGLKIAAKWRMVLVGQRLFGRGDTGDWFEYGEEALREAVDGRLQVDGASPPRGDLAGPTVRA